MICTALLLNQHEHVKTGAPTWKLFPYFHSERGSETWLQDDLYSMNKYLGLIPASQTTKITQNYTQEVTQKSLLLYGLPDPSTPCLGMFPGRPLPLDLKKLDESLIDGVIAVDDPHVTPGNANVCATTWELGPG